MPMNDARKMPGSTWRLERVDAFAFANLAAGRQRHPILRGSALRRFDDASLDRMNDRWTLSFTM
jgi:hypothetical protein